LSRCVPDIFSKENTQHSKESRKAILSWKYAKEWLKFSLPEKGGSKSGENLIRWRKWNETHQPGYSKRKDLSPGRSFWRGLQNGMKNISGSL
jgi:hypothetical protein